MKGLFLFGAMLLIAGMAFATGEPEGIELTVLAGYPEGRAEEQAVERFRAAHPDVTVTMLTPNQTLADGSTISMDSLIASGQAPNLYDDWFGRVGKYMVPEYARPLTTDLDKYLPGVLDIYTKGGDVLAFPRPGGAQGMAINLDIMDEIGYTVDWNWTIDDFLEMCELVKQRYGGEKYGTGMFAGNQSGDYLINNWFAAFGVDYYQNGDYTETTIADGGAAVYEFFQTLVREGYIPEGAATLVDDDYAPAWARGEYAAAAWFPSWAKPYFDAVADQGYEPFRYTFVPFPSVDGRGTPTYVSNAAIVVHNTGDEKVDALAEELAATINSARVQTELSNDLIIPNRSDAVFLPSAPRVEETIRIAEDFGIVDMGVTTPYFAARRPLHFPILQKVLNLTLTPEEAIKEYAAALNSVQ